MKTIIEQIKKNTQKFLCFVFYLRIEKSQICLYTLSNFVQDFKFAHWYIKNNLLPQIFFIKLIYLNYKIRKSELIGIK